MKSKLEYLLRTGWEQGLCHYHGVVHYLTWKELYPAHIPLFEDERGDFPHLPNAGIM